MVLKKKRFLIVFLVAGLLMGLAANADAASQAFNTPSVFGDNQSSLNNGPELSFSTGTVDNHKLSIPSNTPTPLEGVRWPNKRVTIYLAATTPEIKAAFRDAVKRWNKTKAIHLVWTKDEDKAQIVAEEGDLTGQTSGSTVGYVTSQLGSTRTEFNPDTHALLHASSLLDTNQLMGTTARYRSMVAQHELGHAIGLAHAPEYEKSVMIPRNIHTGITKNDIRSVRQLYH